MAVSPVLECIIGKNILSKWKKLAITPPLQITRVWNPPVFQFFKFLLKYSIHTKSVVILNIELVDFSYTESQPS